MGNICVFSHKPFLPPTSGHNITVYNRLVNLVKEGFKVDFYVFGQEHSSFTYDGINIHTCQYSSILNFILFNRFFQRIMKSARSVEAHLVFSSLDPKLASFAREKIRKNDLVLVEHIWSSIFPMLFAKMFNKPVVIIDHNAETVLSRRFLRKSGSLLTKLLLLFRFVYTFMLEKFSCQTADVVVTLSQNDKTLLQNSIKIPSKKIEIIPPSIDTSIMKNTPSLGNKLRKKLGISKKALVVCFLGDLTTIPNFLAAKYIVKEIAPKVLAKLPETVFLIIGKYKKPLLLPKDSNIIFTYEVKDIIPYMSASDICIAPLTLGSGVKLKVLTYLSFGKPVISTSIGMEGINAKDEEEVIVSDIDSFDEEILRLASDLDLMLKMGRKGRKLTEESYDKHSVTEKLASIFDEVVH